jgi:cytochrome b561
MTERTTNAMTAQHGTASGRATGPTTTIAVVAILAVPLAGAWLWSTGAFRDPWQALLPVTFAMPIAAVLLWAALATLTRTALPTRPGAVPWNAVSKAFHWAMAAMILGTSALYYYIHFMDVSPAVPGGRAEYSRLLQIHKSLGLTVLALVGLRWLWNRTHPRPPEHAASHAQARLARRAHAAIYLLMIGVPLAGWCASMTYGGKTKYFGLFELPQWLPKDKALVEFFHPAHTYLAWTLLAIVMLHVVAACWHHVKAKDATLVQMLPGRARGGDGSR